MAFTTHQRDARWQWQSFTRPLARLAAQWQQQWRQRQTEKMLEALPAEIRKDIGWPTGDDADAAVRSLR